MLQISCVRFDDDPVNAVEVVDVPAPRCPERGVVVAVRARPINPADLLLVTGRHAYKPALPEPVGIEGAGEVVEAGAGSRHQIGDLVALPWGGTWRERVAMGDEDVLPLPAGTDLEQAAMLSVNPFTAAGLLEGVAPGATIALNAPTSAVVQLVLAMCRARGIHAIAVARPGADPEPLRARGFYAVVDDGADLSARIRAVAPGPVVRSLDALAGDASGRMFDVVADHGTLMVYGLITDDVVRLPATGLVFRDVTVVGYSRLRVLRALAPERRAALTTELIGMVASGALATPIEARYPLADVAAALRHQARSGRTGKILLVS